MHQSMEELCKLIGNWKISEALEALKNVDPRNLVNDLGESLIHIAAEKGIVSIVEDLLRRGVDVNLQNKNGSTALMLAAAKGDIFTINVIMRFYPDLHIQDNNKRNALQYLLSQIYYELPGLDIAKIHQVLKRQCKGDNEKIAMKLIHNDCRLYTAVHFGNAEVLRIMLQIGYSVKERQEYEWWTALHVAFQVHQLACAKVLMEHGANVDDKCRYEKRTTFSYYRRFDDSDLELEVWQMVFSRSKIFTKNHRLELRQFKNLLEKGKKKVLQALFRSNVNLSAADNQYRGRTALHHLAKNPTLADDQDLIELLGTKQLDIHKVSEIEGNAVCEAAKNGLPLLVQFLLDHNADIHVRLSDETYPPLHCLWLNAHGEKMKRQKNFYECTKLLLRHGVDPQELSKKKTVFDMSWSKINFLLTKPILSHLALLEARKMPITNLIRDKINSHRWLCNQFNVCKLQLARLNEIRVSEFTTLFEFLCKSEEQMTNCLRNDEFLATLEVINEKYKNKSEFFNIFLGYLKKPLKKAQIRKHAAGFVCDITGFSYNQHHMIVDGILKYLTNKDFEIIAVRS